MADNRPSLARTTGVLLLLLLHTGREAKVRGSIKPGKLLKSIKAAPHKPHDSVKGAWFCTEASAGLSPLAAKLDTVERCWAEAVRRRARYLAIDLRRCRVGGSAARLPATACSNTSRHVIDVRYYQYDLLHLDPETRFWVSGRVASGVTWDTVGQAAGRSRGLADCSKFCFKYGQDFARVDYRGCRCGLEKEAGLVMIRHEDLHWTAENRSALDPGFTVKLRAQNVTGWMCTAAPSDFVVFTGAQTMQEALEACQRRRFKFLAAGDDGFFCGNNTANLERFSISQCEMRLTKRRSYSIISIKEIERQITHVEESIREYIFWWVAEKSPDVFWTTLADVSSLEQCVLQCTKRFICVGADGCSCGTLRKDRTDVHVQEWVKARKKQEMGASQGFLMLDKKGNANVPEGWTCTTEPARWRRTADTTLQHCLGSCHRFNNTFAAFGKAGCRCGDSGVSFKHLAMPHCQNPQADASVQPYSVLYVEVWTHNYRNYSAKKDLRPYWVARKPAGVKWEVAPGRTVLDDCVTACRDRRGVKLVLIGVDGCECGFTTRRGVYRPSMGWSRTSPFGAARGFLLVEMNKVSSGYVAPVFRWITKRNNTHQKENKVKETPTWIRVNVAKSHRRDLRRLSKLSKEETVSHNLERTMDTRGSRGLNQRRQRMVTEQKSTTLFGTQEKTTNHTGATEQKEVSKLSRTTHKLAKTKRRKNIMNESEKNYVEARDNEILVGSNKRRLVNIETENAAKKSAENYKKHTITGEQTAGTIEQFISGEKARLMRVNSTNTKVLEKSVAANQTHLATEAVSHKVRRLRIKKRRVTEAKKGKTLSLRIHIGGRCYVGKAKKDEWKGPLTGSHTPFKCLCTCVRKMRLLYAIFDGGQCFCSKKAGDFGTNTGSIVTSGRCPQKGARTVYNGMKHTQKLAQFCRRSHRAATSVLHRERATVNAGHRLIEFNNRENLRAVKKASRLKSTHRARSEEDVRTDVVRKHHKHGRIRENWNSKTYRGPIGNRVFLRLRVRRAHNVTENVNLITKKDVRSSKHERRPLFLRRGKHIRGKITTLLETRPKTKAG